VFKAFQSTNPFTAIAKSTYPTRMMRALKSRDKKVPQRVIFPSSGPCLNLGSCRTVSSDKLTTLLNNVPLIIDLCLADDIDSFVAAKGGEGRMIMGERRVRDWLIE
jgi:hypothetical protein